MSREVAILLAASIAALASIVNLVLSWWSQQAIQRRMARRSYLEKMILELGEALHQVIARSAIRTKKAKGGQAHQTWRSRAEAAQDTLRQLRPKLRYPLWGLDSGIRTLSYIPDWIGHAESDKRKVTALLKLGDSLRAALDKAICRAYLEGKAPTLWQRMRVRALTSRCQRTFNSR